VGKNIIEIVAGLVFAVLLLASISAGYEFITRPGGWNTDFTIDDLYGFLYLLPTIAFLVYIIFSESGGIKITITDKTGDFLFMGSITLIAIFFIIATLKIKPESIAIIGATVFATIGWLFNNRQTAKHFIKKHTFDTVIEFRSSSEMYKHRCNIFLHHEYGNGLSETEYDKWKESRNNKWAKGEGVKTCNPFCENQAADQLSVPPLDSLVYILNSYEYMAYGIEHKELDYTIIRDNIGSSMYNFFNLYRVHPETVNGNNSDTYKYLIDLMQRFRNDKVLFPEGPPDLYNPNGVKASE